MNRIPSRNQVVGQKEWLNILDIAESEHYTHGKWNMRFEKLLAEFVGAKYCVLCNSGSSANLLAVTALTAVELGERRLHGGDEVITTALNFPTTINPIIQNGLVPVFVDVELPYYLAHWMASDDGQTGVIATSFLGNIPRGMSINLIVDNCDAIRKGCHTGRVSTYSFYPAHHMSGGGGGAVCTDDPLLAKLLKSYRDWGRDCWCLPGHNNSCGHRFDGDYDHKYTYSHMGYNLMANELVGALGCAQIEKLPKFIKARKRNFQRYYEGMKDLEHLFWLPEATPGSDPSWFGFPLTIREDVPIDCNEFTQMLDGHGIEVRRMFAGNVLRQPYFKQYVADGGKYRVIGDLKTTDLIMQNGFWLFVSPSLTDKMIDKVLKIIHREVKNG